MKAPLCLALLLGCAGAAEEPGVDAGAEPDAGAPELADAGCGLSFDQAIAAHPGERVCQTTLYDLRTGYCTHWQPCSEL